MNEDDDAKLISRKTIGLKENLKNNTVGDIIDKRLMSIYYLLKEAYPKCTGFHTDIYEENGTDEGVEVVVKIGLKGLEVGDY